ncbi:MAG: DUF72 domain-containing protein [Proteobacteria bacterium]|nr:DUF72 domain-containing protein [Pseudomonadota bacterium]
MTIRIGIGGWTFAPWRGAFYPAKLPHAQELRYAGERLSSIEINGTFYRTQTPASFRKWAAETPDDFVFALKGSRYATHRKPLAEAAPSIERFLGSGPLTLGPKLGPVLWQFAPFLKFDPDDFGAFLKLLPHERDGTKLRHVVEARHASFADPRYIALLREHQVAHAIIESDKHPVIEDLTADFVYLRLERSQDDEPTGYSKKSLDRWATRIAAWASGGEPDDVTRLVNAPAPKAKARDCFVYFISGAKVRNPAAAMAMIERVT